MISRTGVGRVLSWTLMAAGLGWVVYLLVTTVDDPARYFPENLSWFLLATVTMVLSIGSNAALFYLFLYDARSSANKPVFAVGLHLAGQVLRYLPGRVWGIAYQVSASQGKIPGARVARANVDLMAFSLIGSTIVASVIIGARQGWPAWMLVLLAFSGATILATLFLGGANWVARQMLVWLPSRAKRALGGIASTDLNYSRLTQAAAVFALSWTLYVIGWSALAKAFPSFSHIDFVTLSAYYSIASIIGIISAVTPAGLGVREGAFVILASGVVAAEEIAFFAVFGRLWLMTIELLLFATGFVLLRRAGRSR